MVTPEQIDLVEASVAALGPRLDEAVAAFYDRLFALDPTLRGLFPHDLAAQRRKFAAELAFIATVIRRHDRFTAAVGELGARHANRAVRARHVETAGVALLAALGATFGDEWTPALAEAWSLAYRLIAAVMMAALAEAR